MTGKLMKLTLAILVPILFLITLIFLMMSLFGLNPKDGFKGLLSDIPFVSHTSTGTVASTGLSVQQLKAQVKDQSKQNQALQAEISSKTDKINRLQSEIDAMNKQAQDQKKAAKTSQNANQALMIQQTYKNMDPEKAAAIFNKMSNSDAAKYLNMIDDQTKASILENLPADKAAALTPLLKAKVKPTNTSGTNVSSNTNP